MGRRKMWDKVTLVWDLSIGIGTSVGLDGSFNPDLHDPQVSGSGDGKIHRIFGMEVYSYDNEADQRKGKMTLDIRPDFDKTNLSPKSREIRELLEQKFRRARNDHPPCECGAHIEGPVKESWMETKFTLDFVLAHGEQFCDTAINVARGVFEALGVKDSGDYHLADFSLKRETFIRFEKSWITYEQWLRISHRLPVMETVEE